MPDDMSVSDFASTWGVVNVGSSDEANPRDDLRVPSPKTPWAICASILNTSPSFSLEDFAAFESFGLAITCTILYPEQFDALRRTYNCDQILIECKSWNTSGGKFGSAFLKSKGKLVVLLECLLSNLHLFRRMVYCKGTVKGGIGKHDDICSCIL